VKQAFRGKKTEVALEAPGNTLPLVQLRATLPYDGDC
jgi:hypothetical protein